MGNNLETKVGQGTIRSTKTGAFLTKGHIEIKGGAVVVKSNPHVDPRYADEEDPIQTVYPLESVYITKEY